MTVQSGNVDDVFTPPGMEGQAWTERVENCLDKVRCELETSRVEGNDELVAALMVVRHALEISASLLVEKGH